MKIKLEEDWNGRKAETDQRQKQGRDGGTGGGIQLSESLIRHKVPRYPECGQVYIPERLATGCMSEVEKTLKKNNIRLIKQTGEIIMSNFRPGGFKITKKAMEIWKLPEGSEVLDIGCGTGDTVIFLEKEYGFECCGIDLSMARIKEGKSKYPNLNIKYGDGEFLDDFSSFSLDGILMECTLSLIKLPEEVLHEIYCVLKKGGRLFLSDLYIKDPDPGFIKLLRIEAERQSRKPHKEGECGTDCEEEHKNRLNSFRSDGRFLMEPLVEQLKEIGFQSISWEDCSLELDNFVAEMLMKEGTLEGCICDAAFHPKDYFKTGYFMLTAEKPIVYRI